MSKTRLIHLSCDVCACAASPPWRLVLVVRVAEVAEGAQAALQCASSSSFSQTCRTRDGCVYKMDSIILTLPFLEYFRNNLFLYLRARLVKRKHCI